MVHALREAHRVLRPNGILLDLRPAPVHRRVGLGRDRRWRLVGVMRETFEKDRAADGAVSQAVRKSLFRRGARSEFVLDRRMDSVADFRAWLEDFGPDLAPHDWLIRRLEHGLEQGQEHIVARGPVTMQLLRKVE